MGRTKTQASHHQGPGRALKSGEARAAIAGHPDLPISTLRFFLLLVLPYFSLESLSLPFFEGRSIFAFCALPKRKTASCLLPSTRVTISLRQLPAQSRSVFHI